MWLPGRVEWFLFANQIIEQGQFEILGRKSLGMLLKLNSSVYCAISRNPDQIGEGKIIQAMHEFCFGSGRGLEMQMPCETLGIPKVSKLASRHEISLGERRLMTIPRQSHELEVVPFW